MPFLSLLLYSGPVWSQQELHSGESQTSQLKSEAWTFQVCPLSSYRQARPMSNSDLRNKKRLLRFLNPVLSISTVHQRKVLYFQLFRGRKSKYFKMFKVLILSFPLSASIPPLTQMALLAIYGAFFEPPGMPQVRQSPPFLTFGLPQVLGTFALVFTWEGAQPGTSLYYVLYPCPIPQYTKVIWSYSLFSPVVLVPLLTLT